jgi:hypothetical protein
MNTTSLSHAFAIERAKDFACSARRARLIRHVRRQARLPESGDVVIRAAQDSDTEAVARLATLNSRGVPDGRLLVASVQGAVRAAIGQGGEILSDPFAPSADVVALLKMRARQLGTR